MVSCIFSERNWQFHCLLMFLYSLSMIPLAHVSNAQVLSGGAMLGHYRHSERLGLPGRRRSLGVCLWRYTPLCLHYPCFLSTMRWVTSTLCSSWCESHPSMGLESTKAGIRNWNSWNASETNPYRLTLFTSHISIYSHSQFHILILFSYDAFLGNFIKWLRWPNVAL